MTLRQMPIRLHQLMAMMMVVVAAVTAAMTMQLQILMRSQATNIKKLFFLIMG
jgi:hypothetical protein